MNHLHRTLAILGLLGLLVSAWAAPSARAMPHAGAMRADAIVLVNSASAGYGDFQHYIQPYLDHFGVPYTTLDIATTPVPIDIGDYALIIIGHRGLDTSGAYLSSTEQALLTAAVSAGTGLVNFDGDLADAGNAPRYTFIQDIFQFTYSPPEDGQIISFYATEGPPASPTMHYIVANHGGWEELPLKSAQTITVVRVNVPLADHVTELMSVDMDPTAPPIALPLLMIAPYNQGRAVQWLSYDWMKSAVKGPMYALDDEIWRGLVWAARKPFVMQALPPLVTMRVDDVASPTGWVPTAISYGLKPWLGLFINDLNATETNLIRTWINNGDATAAIHAFSTNNYFYFDDATGQNWPDATLAANYAAGTAWHTSNNIPISKYVVPHHYEIGSNAFGGLAAWGVQFIGVPMNPGQVEDSEWIMNGPYRLYETGRSFAEDPLYYADFITVPDHDEFAGQFFNCLTEIRDVAGYEWYPIAGDVSTSVLRGTRQLRRALDNLAIATLFTHEYNIDPISNTQWQAMLSGITADIAGYAPRYVTMDYACQYARAQHTSSISASTYDPILQQLSTTLVGQTDLATDFYVFTDDGDNVVSNLVPVPVFSGSTVVNANVGPALDHILVTPNPASVEINRSQPFTALGYDAGHNLIRGLRFTWSIVNGGGAIDQTGLFTAGSTPGAYANTVAAALGTVQGTASVNVTLPSNFRRLWNDSTLPANANTNDGQPIEVGIKFQSSAAGYIHGVRFYKGALNTGLHVGSLWSIDGNLLAQATFVDETAVGWQVVTFTTPVAISANTYYVASYYSPGGTFAETPGYFASQGVSQPPLSAPAAGVIGPNGVYRYGASGFPNSGSSNNYWVDVTFATGSSPTAVMVRSLTARPDVPLPLSAVATALVLLAIGAVVWCRRR